MGEGRARAQSLERYVGGIVTVLNTLVSGPSEWTAVNCAAADFAFEGGVATSNVLLFDSPAATVTGAGSLDLRSEGLDFLVTPEAKSVTLNVATPVVVGGSLAQPTFAPDPAALARKIAGLLGIVVFPPAAVAGLGELGAGGNPCVDLAAAGESSAPAAEAPAPSGPAAPAQQLRDGLGNAIQGIGEGLQNLLGR